MSGFPNPSTVTRSGLFVVGAKDGLVYDNGKTNNTAQITALATEAQAMGFGDMWVLADPSGNYLGLDWDVPSELSVHGVGPTLLKNPGNQIPASGGYNGTAFGPCIGGVGVAPIRLGGNSSTLDNCLTLGTGPGNFTSSFPTQVWHPTAGAAPAVGYGVLLNGFGCRLTRVICLGGTVASFGITALGTTTIDSTNVDVTCVNQLNPQGGAGYLQLADRSDAATWTAGVALVNDASIAAADQWSPVTSGLTGPTNQVYVGTVVPGVSFVPISASGNPITTLTGTGATITIGQFHGGGIYEAGSDHMFTNLRVLAGGFWFSGADFSVLGGHFSFAGQVSNGIVNQGQGGTFTAPIFDIGTNTPASMVEVRSGLISFIMPRFIANGAGPSVAAIVDKTTGSGGVQIQSPQIPLVSAGGITTLLDNTGAASPGTHSSLTGGRAQTSAALTNWFNGTIPNVFRDNAIAAVVAPSNSAPSTAGSNASVFAFTNGQITTPTGVTNSLGFDAFIGGSISVTASTAGQLINVGVGSTPALAVANVKPVIVLPTVATATPFAIPTTRVPQGWAIAISSNATTLAAGSASLISTQAD